MSTPIDCGEIEKKNDDDDDEWFLQNKNTTRRRRSLPPPHRPLFLRFVVYIFCERRRNNSIHACITINK